MKLVAAIIIPFLALLSYTLACRPILRIYESECCGDDYVEVAREWIGVNNEPNLTAHGLKNWYINTCPEGVWMGYAQENYTGMTSILYSYGDHDGLNTCRYENTGRKFRSVKIVGSSASYTKSALTTYVLDLGKAVGDDHVYLNDTSYLPGGTFTALILTGNDEVELFTSSYFSGLSVCVRPHNGYIYNWSGFQEKNDDRNGSYLFTELSDLENIFGTNHFNSFTFGCRNNTNTLVQNFRNSPL